MAGQFPEELIDLIISHLDDDASIRLCGLVCRSWLYSSRFYAFENVTLNDGNTAPFLELVETSFVSLPSLIGALDLTEPWPGDSESENIDWLEGIDRLGSCPRMTYLYVQIGDRGLSHLSPFLSALSSLTTTEFSVVPNNSAGSILEILPSLPPSVKNLNIFSLIEDFFQDQTFLSASRLPEGLCTLYLSDDAQNFFSALLLLPQTPLLSTVHVRNAWPAQNSALEKYLCFVGEALQELTLDTGDIPLSTQDEPFALRHNTALRHLSIATPPHQMPEVLLKTIPHLSSPELVTISMSRMNVPWGSGQIGNLDSALNPWRAVDSALAGPAFAGLKTLEIATRWMPPRRNTIPSQPKNIPPKFKPPPKPKASERIRSAILACILDPKYCPPAFPALEDLFWPDSFSKTEEEDEGASAAERDYYAQIGFATLQQVLFLLIRPHLRGKPVGFSKAIQNAVHTHEILKLAIGNINPKVLDKVSKVEGGCHALVGALWIQFGEDTERFARWLDPIFWPLLEAAGDKSRMRSEQDELLDLVRHNTALRHLSIITPPHQMPDVLLKIILYLSSPELMTISYFIASSSLTTNQMATNARTKPPNTRVKAARPKANLPKPRLNDVMRDAVHTYIASNTYQPPPMPQLSDPLGWPKSFSPTKEEDGPSSSPAIDRAFYAEVGTSTLDRVLFLLVVDELRGKPIGFSKTVQRAVHTQEALRLVLQKLNPSFLDGVSKVDGGFYEFLGALWIQYGQNTAEMVSALYPIFQPLLEAAGNAYLDFYSDSTTKEPKKPEKNRQAKLPAGMFSNIRTSQSLTSVCADLQFLVNVRKAQRERTSFLPPATPQSSARRDPSSDLFLSPTSPTHPQDKAEQGDSPPYVLVVRDSDHEPSVLEFSPMVFTPDPSPSFANHADILGADLNEFMIFNNRSPIHADNASPWNPPPLRHPVFSMALPGSERPFTMELDASPARRTNSSTMGATFKRYSALAPAFVEKTYPPLHVEGSPEQLLDPALLVIEQTPDRPRPPLTPSNYNYNGRQLGTPFKVAARVLDFMVNV
ncbi:hypothetical protein B0H11DRAFT_2240865 [Mycena galericulata]|nr:hypothetical protein B0H11DRAFT_2240865 [Mycena galericulata]